MCVIEIRPGQGGADALAFASDLAAAIESWARHQRWPAARQATAGRTVHLTLTGVPPETVA